MHPGTFLSAEKTHDGFVEFRRIAACREMIAANKAKLRIRDRRCDQLGMAPFHEITRSGDNKRRRGDPRKTLRQYVRLIHHKSEKLSIFLRVCAFSREAACDPISDLDRNLRRAPYSVG